MHNRERGNNRTDDDSQQSHNLVLRRRPGSAAELRLDAAPGVLEIVLIFFLRRMIVVPKVSSLFLAHLTSYRLSVPFLDLPPDLTERRLMLSWMPGLYWYL